MTEQRVYLQLHLTLNSILFQLATVRFSLFLCQMYLCFFFFFASVTFWTVPSICWQLFWLLAAQTLTVNGMSPFFYSFLLSWEMLLNASQPFSPWGGVGCCGGRTVAVREDGGMGAGRRNDKTRREGGFVVDRLTSLSFRYAFSFL